MPAHRAVVSTRADHVSIEDRFNLAFSRLFTYLSPRETEALLSRADLIECEPGEFLLFEGAPVEALYIIVEGEAKVMKRDHAYPVHHKLVELARLGLGSIIGEMSFLDGDVASASVMADRPMKLYRINRAVIVDLIEHSPEFSTNFYRSLAGILSRRLRLANTILTSTEHTRVVTGKDHYRIFVIDDDPDILKFINLFLENAGHTVRTGASAMEALSAIGQFRPDLVITDLMMSGMNGLDLCKEIRSRPEFTAMKIIMMSVRPEAVWAEKALEAGANGFFMKPLNPETIVMQVEQAMRPVRARAA